MLSASECSDRRQYCRVCRARPLFHQRFVDARKLQRARAITSMCQRANEPQCVVAAIWLMGSETTPQLNRTTVIARCLRICGSNLG